MLKQHPVNKENRLLVVGEQSVIAGTVEAREIRFLIDYK